MSKLDLSEIPNLIEACQANLDTLNERLLSMPELTGNRYATLASLIRDMRLQHSKIYEIIQREFNK